MTSAAACTLAPYAVQPYRARRASHLSAAERLSAAMFGSPSARRANGGAQTSFMPRALRTRAWRARRASTPVFEVDRKGAEASERLPRIWVTEPAFDERTGAYLGRAYVGVYPCDSDRGGWRALELAERYCGEARGCEGAAAEILRTECFRAAEILYLHAAQRGNVEACAKLGLLYLGDLRDAARWKGLLEQRARHAACAAPEERAFAWLMQAALRGHAEACCALGDLLVEGRGCAVDLPRAYRFYRRAFDAAAHKGASARAQAGAAALRLARCHELGLGCAHGFDVALSWCRMAADLLGQAVEDGSWRYKRQLHEARTGVRRMRQETSGAY
ncbi:tetratricopeptide repeat protein [Adlercreutzia sp. ZJ473]|uniref:tetratricopeptide repeat protein n=1 Tax=Adlercreutzia sp. ZJ473 TaxID=2722822 RepID=UPI001553E150|nr:sel1 repeat family protein [Adlercreutzia sp. ZJ473]